MMQTLQWFQNSRFRHIAEQWASIISHCTVHTLLLQETVQYCTALGECEEGVPSYMCVRADADYATFYAPCKTLMHCVDVKFSGRKGVSSAGNIVWGWGFHTGRIQMRWLKLSTFNFKADKYWADPPLIPAAHNLHSFPDDFLSLRIILPLLMLLLLVFLKYCFKKEKYCQPSSALLVAKLGGQILWEEECQH